MKSYLDCLPCFVRQALDSCRKVTGDEKQIRRILEKTLAYLSAADLDQPPPVVGAAVHRIIRRELGSDDPYREIKKRSTEKGLELAEDARRMIAASADPFAAAVRFSIAGNILDFGAKTDWDEERILNSFRSALDTMLSDDKTALLYEKLKAASNVLFLGDNAGEAVFDNILIQHFPGKAAVYYAVKGFPVINDVTEEDAIAAGLHESTRIISNGTDIPGTSLEDSSEEFKQLFRTADVVISKGQGNFETLYEESREIFFLLQIKCRSLAQRNGFSVGDWIAATINTKEAHYV